MKQMIYDGSRKIPSCHSSTITAMPNGQLFSTWFAGSGEGANDVAIYGGYKYIDKEWQISLVAKVKESGGFGTRDYPHWNPVVAYYGDRLNLFFKVGPSPSNWWTYLTTSGDFGKNWSAPKQVNFGPVKNKPILMSNDDMICGVSTEINYVWKSYIQVFTQDNKAKQIVEIKAPTGVGLIQPTVWESTPGFIHAFMRSNVGLIYRSDSVDFGYTWAKAYPTSMPNNNSGIDVINDPRRKRLMMVWNPIWSPNISARRRGVLSIAYSLDNGVNWRESMHPNIESSSGEYSYPAIILNIGDYHITYTHNRTNIAYYHVRNV